MRKAVAVAGLLSAVWLIGEIRLRADDRVSESDDVLKISLPELEAAIRKQGYVTGVAAQSLLDKKTGFRDAGFGLDIVDWIMEPGSDEAYRDKLDKELVYQFNNRYHGKTPKRSIEGPQICTQAKTLEPVAIPGKDFVAVTQKFQYRTAAPGQEDRLGLEPDARLSGRASGTSSRATGSRRSTAARRCFCGSTCRGTSSTSRATRSARCT